MNEEILQEAGLTKAEATIYVLLVKNSPSSPPKLADFANESRTNTYKLLDSLEEKGLVTRDDTQKKLRYWANNPTTLLENLKKQRAEMETAEKRFQDSLPTMIDEYFKHSEQPSIRYFHGIDGIRQIYQDQLDDAKPITFTMSFGIRDFYGETGMHQIRNEFPKRGIPRRVFYPDVAHVFEPGEPKTPIAESDRLMLLDRTWVSPDDLKAPVEWGVYGNKLSIISLGTEVVGMVIESPQIAASFLEILTLLEHNIRNQPGYDKLPKNLLYTKKPTIG
jgi:DNA-binding MarR family transcriptional regulator